GLPGPTALSVHTDNAGGLWVGTDRGVARFVNGRFVSVPVAEGRELSRPMTITSTATALLVRDQDRGLLRWDGRVLVPFPIDPSVDRGVLSTRADAHGRLWFGYPGGRVVVRESDGRVRTFNTPVGSVSTMYGSPASGAMWIGGSSGVSRIDRD